MCIRDSVWVTRDAAGRDYPVDRYGGRWTKQRLRPTKTPEDKRPAEVHTDVWRHLTAKERREWWEAKTPATPAPCAVAAQPSCHESDEEGGSTAEPDSEQDVISDDDSVDEYAPLAVPPWVEWDREAYAWDPARPCAVATPVDPSTGGSIPAPRAGDDVPAMPCIKGPTRHRCKLADSIYPFHACVARP
eukprot:11261871-Alexandrium_andersonii.AAC.1